MLTAAGITNTLAVLFWTFMMLWPLGYITENEKIILVIVIFSEVGLAIHVFYIKALSSKKT